jgi:hypothetical protein
MNADIIQKIEERIKPNTIMKYTGDPESVLYYIILDLKKTLVRKLSGKYDIFEVAVKCVGYQNEEFRDMIGRIYKYDIDQWDLEYWSAAND